MKTILGVVIISVAFLLGGCASSGKMAAKCSKTPTVKSKVQQPKYSK